MKRAKRKFSFDSHDEMKMNVDMLKIDERRVVVKEGGVVLFVRDKYKL